MPDYPWFRLYSNDLLSDRKLNRVSAVLSVPKATVRGVWLTLMAMANDSPVRGECLIAVDIPVTEQEMCDDCGLGRETFDALLAEFEALGMIERGECVTLCNFLTRNPPSDSSAERVRRYRARQKQQNVTVTETLPSQSSNAIESESDPESESESESDPETLQTTPKKEPTSAMQYYEDRFGLFNNAGEINALIEVEQEVGLAPVKAAIDWAHSKGVDRVSSIITAARGWTADTSPPGGNGPDPPQPQEPVTVTLEELNATPDWMR